MRPTIPLLVSTLVLLESACTPSSVPSSPSPSPSPTKAPPTETLEPSPTALPSNTPLSATETPVPQPILLRRPCGKDYIVRENQPLQIFYGGWGVAGKELADQWATSLIVELAIDGQPVAGEIQVPTHELPYNCRPSEQENTYWVYYMTVIPGLPAGDHDVLVTFSSLRPLPDGSGPIWGPGQMFENSFLISAQ